ncbi:MAG TPA: hypothetical protein ENN99_10475 [Chloroflexi bacterium]|nr:hypothetical protein [Chloroflexota bacterium]
MPIKVPVPLLSLPTLVKPTIDTPFHIDYDWWERKGLQISVELRAHLCQEHQGVFKDHFDTEKIDWVDGRTGEVTQVDGLQHILQIHCSKQPNYINEHLSLVDAAFRMLLANGNTPLTCKELSSILGQPANKILHTLSGRTVYKGIRPVQEN